MIKLGADNQDSEWGGDSAVALEESKPKLKKWEKFSNECNATAINQESLNILPGIHIKVDIFSIKYFYIKYNILSADCVRGKQQ